MAGRGTAADEESDGVAVTDGSVDVIDRHVEDERFSIVDLAVQDGGVVMDKVVGFDTRDFIGETIDDGRIGRRSENTRSKVLRVNEFSKDSSGKALIDKTNTNAESVLTRGDQSDSDPVSTGLQTAWRHNKVRIASIAVVVIASPSSTTAVVSVGDESSWKFIDSGNSGSITLGNIGDPVGLTEGGI
jgi:hypothetical protein